MAGRIAAIAAVLWLAATPARIAHAAEGDLELARRLNNAFAQVAARVSPSVVVVEVRQKLSSSREIESPLLDMLPEEFRRGIEEELRRREQEDAPNFVDGRGSGVIIREDGYILTNTHVLEHAERVRVRLRDGREFDAAEFWTDPQSDVAVIRIDAENLPAARLADSDKVRVGEFAIAIGAPLNLDYSVTFGHVSAKGRQQVVPGFTPLGRSMDQDFIQTDASINHGNSGGPLVNIEGEVIGINAMIRGLNTGIGFAIPSNLARQVSEQLISEGRYVRAWIGIGVVPVKGTRLATLGEETVDEGLVVENIMENGPAAKSALKLGDVIVQVEGHPVRDARELRGAVRSKPVGGTIAVDIMRWTRDGEWEEKTIEMTTEEWPEEALVFRLPEPRPRAPAESARFRGMTVRPLTPELAEKYELEEAAGVVVTEVEPDSLAEEAGIRAGDVITEIRGQEIRGLNDFRSATRNADLRRGVMVNVITDGTASFRILKERGD